MYVLVVNLVYYDVINVVLDYCECYINVQANIRVPVSASVETSRAQLHVSLCCYWYMYICMCMFYIRCYLLLY